MKAKVTANTARELAFLSGGGEMGARIRAFDWTQTPLGPPAGWAQSLKTAVRIMLASRQPIWIGWGDELIYLYNDPYKAIIGGRHPSALGKPTTQVWPEIWDVIGPMLQTAMRGVEGTYVEEQLLIMERHGYREETYYTYSYTPIPDDDGGTGGIICANTDDTQRVIGQRQLALLRELSNAVSAASSPQQVCELAANVFAGGSRDVSFALIYLNDPQTGLARLQSVSGGPFDERLAPRVVSLHPQEAAAAPFWPFQQALAGQTVVVGGLQQRASLPGGAWPEATETALVMPLGQGGSDRPVGLLVVGASPRRALDERYSAFFDLLARNLTSAITTARARQEERQRAESLVELDRAKTTFFSDVSHEFRTPLTLLLGPLEEALRDPRAEQDSQWRARLELMRRNGLRLQKLVNTLLDFSRLEAGRIEANYEPTDLGAFTAHLASMFDSAMQRAGLDFQIDCPSVLEAAYVDRDMWEKIVMNLLSNAFKFTLQGVIRVALARTSRGFELTVADTGVGVAAAEMPQLFERFHRVRQAQARTQEGTGIGLALTHELVRLHGGDIAVESEPGHGTRFTVRIPAGAAHLPADRISATHGVPSTAVAASSFVEEALRWLPASSAAGPLSTWWSESPAPGSPRAMPCFGARVLVAEDNADMRQYLQQLLAPYWVVETVADGATALAAVRDRPPELIVSDVMMPRLDGFELLAALRNDERTRDLPVILLSARAGEEAAIDALAAGADAYLVKPFSARELVAYVASHLQLQRLRRENHAALRASEEKFAAAFSQSPLALTITSLADGRLVEVNDGFVQLSGYTAQEAVGRTIDELQLWVEPQRRQDGLSQLRAGKRVFGAEVRFRTKTGEQRIGMVGSTVIQVEGAPHVLSSTVDVTDRRRSEALLAADLHAFTRLHDIGNLCARAAHDAQRCFQEILAAAMDFTGAERGNIQLFDAASKQLEIVVQRGFDARFLEFFGRAGDHQVAACSAALRSADRVLIEDVTQSEVFAGQPARAVMLDAGVRAMHSTPLLSSEGVLLGVISTHFGQPHVMGERELRLMDLLARQTADYLERKQADEALRQRTLQFETLINQAPLGVYLVDAELRIQQVNPTALPVFGEIPELIGCNLEQVLQKMWGKPYADEIVCIYRHTLESGEAYATAERGEYRIDRGVTEYYEWRVDRITLPDGQYGVVCYFRDISAQVRAREQLAALNTTLREADRRKDEFLAMLGHELRNPLAAVRNAVAIASLDETHRSRALDIARRQSEQLGRLIDDLLDVARITQGRISLRKERVYLDVVLDQAIQDARSFIDSRRITLDVAAPPAAVAMDADPARLAQVFVNLLLNAGKFTDAGGRISVRTRLDAHSATVSISDTGIGITPEVLSRMWDLFAQADRSLDRAEGGLGIGLTIARRLVELHGGRIEAKSDGLGHGAEFSVTLPVLPAQSEDKRRHEASDLSGMPGRSARVLLVEDNRDAAESMTMLLELFGHDVRAAFDGIDGLNAARASVPDIMLVDIGLPGIDGYEVARRVRRDPALKGVVLVALTGYGRVEDKTAALAAGFDYHLVKPVNPDALRNLVGQLAAGNVEPTSTVH